MEPGSHARQYVEPKADARPLGQVEHSLLLLSDATVPSGQRSQAAIEVALSVAAEVPGGQPKHESSLTTVCGEIIQRNLQ